MQTAQAAILHRHYDDDLEGSDGSVTETDKADQQNREPQRALLARLRARDAATRKTAAQEAGEQQLGGVAPALVELLRDGNSGVAATAAWALGQMRYEEADEALTSLLGASGIAARQSAARALGHLATPRAIDALLSALPGADEPLMSAILPALDALPSAAVVPRLVDLLRHADGPTRARAQRALLRRPAEAETATLTALGGDAATGEAAGQPDDGEAAGQPGDRDDTAFRRAAAYILAETATPAALVALLDLSHAADPRTRLYAVRGLKRLTQLAQVEHQARTRLVDMRDDPRRDVAAAATDASEMNEEGQATTGAGAAGQSASPVSGVLPLDLPPGLPYLLTVLPGLEEVAAAEIEDTAGARVTRRFTGALLVALAAPPDTLERLRTVQDALLDAGALPDVAAETVFRDMRPLRRAFGTITERYPDLPRTVYVHLPRGIPQGEARRIRTVVAGDLERVGFRIDTAGSALTAEVVPVSGRWLLGIRVLRDAPGHRPLPAGGVPASLNATLAAALVRLTRPDEHDRFLDPLCGAGTILRERAQAGPYARLLGGDRGERALALARANLEGTPRLALRRWEATRLPLPDASMDKAATNPPYGVRAGSHAANERLYPALLDELARVVRPEGLVAVVTGEKRLTTATLRAQRAFAREDELSVETGGLRVAVYLLRRR